MDVRIRSTPWLPPSRAARALARGLAAIATIALAAVAIADAPPGKFSVSDDGTVVDMRTGLMWQRNVDAMTFTQEEAAAYCEQLTLAGLGDWTLPSVRQLVSIVDASRTSPAIDPLAFPATPAVPFWTATAFLQPPGGTYWIVDFQHGSTANEPPDMRLRVRCVR